MNSLPIFFQATLNKRLSATTKGNEDDFCPICEENKVSIMLDCYVSLKF
jgi:hypothetical protein